MGGTGVSPPNFLYSAFYYRNFGGEPPVPTHTHKHTHTHTHTHSLTHSHTCTQTDRQTDRHQDTDRDTQTPPPSFNASTRATAPCGPSLLFQTLSSVSALLYLRYDKCQKRPRNRPIKCQKRPRNRPIKEQQRPKHIVTHCYTGACTPVPWLRPLIGCCFSN